MNAQQKEVLRKIIYAVETGGQVYGNAKYDDFTEAYTNTSSEHAITIGAGQWYATEAKRLLDLIRSTDAAMFARLDTAGVGADLDSADWSTYKLSKGSAKAACIVAIIDTSVGHACQDKLIDEQMASYCSQAAALGVSSAQGQAMCANFCHQGGVSAMKRIIAKTATPYTLDNLYAASKTDTGGQVGTYTSRQKFVYDNLKSRMVENDSYEKIEAAIAWAVATANDDSHGYDQGRRDGPDYDCSSLMCHAWQNAGVDVIGGGDTPYTGNMRSVFLNHGFSDVRGAVDIYTQAGLLRGDVLLSEGHHTAMYMGNGRMVDAKINEKGEIIGGQTGDQTGYEICVEAYNSHGSNPWNVVLRYKSGGAGGGGEDPEPEKLTFIRWIPA